MSAGRLFVVDDNPNNLSFLTGILRDAGYEVHVANSGRRALAAILLHPPELVLLDVNMPDMNGYQVCEELKRDARTQEIPVIFLSALDDVRDKVSGFRAGGVDFVTKPFHAEEVLARIDNQLRLARLRGELVNKNQELARKNAELMAAWSDADGIFTTLSDVLAGTTLNGRYQLEVKIGSGGFAAVYRGVDLKEGRPVAVKVLRPQPGVDANRQRQQFRQEGVSAARLTHPNAVVVLDSGVTSVGLAFLVMELLQGRSLADEMREEGRLTPTRCAEILPAICDALATAHAAGIIHRDIKPANIFLHRGPDGEIVKVVDFGIAKLEDPAELDNATTAGRVLGTPVYMSPERLMGQPYDGRADVYGLGMVLYEALAGRMPFDIRENEGLGSLIWTCIWTPPLPLRHVNPTIPAPVAAVVMRAISKQPEERPAMVDLADEFSRALLAGQAPAQLEPTLDRPIKPR